MKKTLILVFAILIMGATVFTTDVSAKTNADLIIDLTADVCHVGQKGGCHIQAVVKGGYNPPYTFVTRASGNNVRCVAPKVLHVGNYSECLDDEIGHSYVFATSPGPVQVNIYVTDALGNTGYAAVTLNVLP